MDATKCKKMLDAANNALKPLSPNPAEAISVAFSLLTKMLMNAHQFAEINRDPVLSVSVGRSCADQADKMKKLSECTSAAAFKMMLSDMAQASRTH